MFYPFAVTELPNSTQSIEVSNTQSANIYIMTNHHAASDAHDNVHKHEYDAPVNGEFSKVIFREVNLTLSNP